jgi:hypothetical protein
VIGDPIDADSWAQAFYQTTAELGNKPFSVIQLRINDVVGDTWSPDTFEKATNFTLSGWGYSLYGGGQYLVMSGPTVTTAQGRLDMNVYFSGPQTDRLSFSVQVYNSQGERLQNQDFYWNPGWSNGPGTWNQRGAIPEPVTMAGLMLGIGSVVTYVHKRRNA